MIVGAGPKLRRKQQKHSLQPRQNKDGKIGTKDDNFTPEPDLSIIPEKENIEIVPCEVKKGECMFHHCLTWHGSPPNPSVKGRPAIAVHYMPGWTRYEPTRSHIMERRVDVEPGEVLTGKYFPTVWNHGPISPPKDQLVDNQ